MTILSEITSQPKLFLDFLSRADKTKLSLFFILTFIATILKKSIFLDLNTTLVYRFVFPLYISIIIMGLSKSFTFY
jgi:hypothetical protein